MESAVYSHQTVGILIDGNNIDMGINGAYGSAATLDYLKFVPKLLNTRKLIFLHYFREGSTISDKFREFLKVNFYGVAKPCGKSADVALAIQAVSLASEVNTIVIFSGDVDFCPLVEYLRSVGKRVEIVYVAGTESKVLLEKADNAIGIQRIDTRFNKVSPISL